MKNKKYQWVYFSKDEDQVGVCRSYDCKMTESEFLEHYKSGNEKRFDFIDIQDGFMYVDKDGFKSYPVEYAPSKLLNRLYGAA